MRFNIEEGLVKEHRENEGNIGYLIESKEEGRDGSLKLQARSLHIASDEKSRLKDYSLNHHYNSCFDSFDEI